MQLLQPIFISNHKKDRKIVSILTGMHTKAVLDSMTMNIPLNFYVVIRLGLTSLKFFHFIFFYNKWCEVITSYLFIFVQWYIEFITKRIEKNKMIIGRHFNSVTNWLLQTYLGLHLRETHTEFKAFSILFLSTLSYHS